MYMFIHIHVHFVFQWFDLDAPESTDIPGRYSENITEFQKLLVLRCFRIDRVFRAITNFVTIRMGEQFVTPPVVNLENVLEQSTPFSPIVFVLSPGADPAGELGKLAEIKGYGGNRFKFLAMGQGQEKVIQDMYICNHRIYLFPLFNYTVYPKHMHFKSYMYLYIHCMLQSSLNIWN